MSETTNSGGKNTKSKEAKRRSNVLKYGCGLPAAIFFFLLVIAGIVGKLEESEKLDQGTLDSIRIAEAAKKKEELARRDPLNLGYNAVSALVGKKVPYSKWKTWGSPETLEGTNNQFWVAYLPKANISFVSAKATNKVLFANFEKNNAVTYLKERQGRRNEQIQEQFSAWDGSHRNLERAIKKAMNDPDSYEHVETRYGDQGDHLIVVTNYRGKNAFGGKVLGMVKAKVSLNGDIIEIIEQQ